MTAEDKREFQNLKMEIQTLLNTGIEHLKEVIELKTENIEEKQDRTIVQTTKTNGTVIKHTEQITELIIEQARIVTLLELAVNHTIENCPHTKTVNELRDAKIEITGADKWKKRFETMLIVTLTFVATLVSVFTFLSKYNPN
jgi:hypothetical protein